MPCFGAANDRPVDNVEEEIILPPEDGKDKLGPEDNI
jgi:hypothetical protein